MSLKDEEIELLREQNKLLKMQLDLLQNNEETKSKKKRDVDDEKEQKKTTGLIILLMFIVFIICVLVVLLVKSNMVDDSSNIQSGECIEWENIYSGIFCKYDPNREGCQVTGKKCVKWSE